jgi:hypothetical protein
MYPTEKLVKVLDGIRAKFPASCEGIFRNEQGGSGGKCTYDGDTEQGKVLHSVGVDGTQSSTVSPRAMGHQKESLKSVCFVTHIFSLKVELSVALNWMGPRGDSLSNLSPSMMTFRV